MALKKVLGTGRCGGRCRRPAGSAWTKTRRAFLATVPTNRDLLFWTQPQRDAAFRALDASRCWAKASIVPASHRPCPGATLKLKERSGCLHGRPAQPALLVVADN